MDRKSPKSPPASTDNRLLETAVDLFGRKGLEGVSTRAIAAAADTAMSSITYHYGGKEGLYLATARHIAEKIEGGLSSALSHLPSTDAIKPEEALPHILAVVDGMLGLMLNPQSAAWARFIVREQMEPTEAFEILYRHIFDRVAGRMIALVEHYGNGRWSHDDARLKLVGILGQVVVFRVARATALRFMEWDDIDPAQAAKIRRAVHAHCRAILSTDIEDVS